METFVYHVVTEKTMSLNRQAYQIVKLQVTGNIFTGDAHNCFDDTINKEYNLQEAKNYWQNKPNKKIKNLFMKL